ncbi:rod shape-determining protein MreD [Anaerococcus sp. Marseille-P3625]|uniref:rod shape-determining protein MreD n=1 Tax=Anaerococcus sp. Marseille-P3625 TaxID=1977277 RepID=UPI000C0830EA|nr:rod shape-determining protein MreD [Anaerococcus sp. Marseille-P3625]
MNKFKTFIILLVSFILQTTIFSKIDIFGANVNLLLPAIVAISQVLASKTATYGALFVGLLEDFLFTNFIGVRALSYFLLGSFVASDSFRFGKSKVTGFILTIIASIFNFLLLSLIYYILTRQSGFFNYIPLPLVVESLLNGLIYLIYILIVKKIMYIPTYRM